MRITKNDVSSNVYTSTVSIDSEGNKINSYVFLHTVNADWQPISGRTKIEEYGLNIIPAGGKLVFCDSQNDFPINSIAVLDSKNYQCVGLLKWYSHCEVIMVPFNGSI